MLGQYLKKPARVKTSLHTVLNSCVGKGLPLICHNSLNSLSVTSYSMLECSLNRPYWVLESLPVAATLNPKVRNTVYDDINSVPKSQLQRIFVT
jgi:hypothetical protein